jgi:nucleoside-diphosphate-sugar epimerase
MLQLLLVVVNALFTTSLANKRPEVLITGGCGFVGRHFSSTLCKLGWKITIIDNMISESALPLHKWPSHLKLDDTQCEYHLYELDCREFFQSHESHHNYDLFVHLAAVVGGRAKIEGSPLAVADDLSIDAAAFQWAIDTTNKNLPKNMVYFSSSAAYPVKYQTSNEKTHKLLTENMINLVDDNSDISKPDLTYGWAKLTGEYLSKLSTDYYHLNVSVYRPMSGYGEDQHNAYPFKSILLKAMNHDNPINIWSDATRDFIHISDIVQCVLKTYKVIPNAKPVNLGLGIPIAFSKLAKIMAKEMGYEAEVSILQNMPQGVMYRVGDPTLERSLGCEQVVSIEEGIRKAIQLEKETKLLQADEIKENADMEHKKRLRKHAKQAHGHSDQDGDPIYSSYYCTGGSQIVEDKYWDYSRAWIPFPLYRAQFRACKLHNVCWSNGELTYYEDPMFSKKKSLEKFSMASWKELFWFGSWATHASTFTVKREPLPIKDAVFDDAKYHFLDRNSASYNYGHYLLDNVAPTYIMAKQFNVDFNDTRQVFEHSCRQFDAWNESVSQTKLGFIDQTFREACVEKLNTWWKYFYNYPPMYLEPIFTQDNICFKTLFVGQGSTFGLKTGDSSRPFNLRAFRNFVIERLTVDDQMPEQENIILVGTRSPGHTVSTKFESELCDLVKSSLKILKFDKVYSVKCIVNQDLGFVEEIKQVQSAKILISSAGTISYMSLFARDNTHQIVLYNTEENRLKENNVLMYMTHVSVYWSPIETSEKSDFTDLLQMTIRNLQYQENMEDATLSINHKSQPTNYHQYDKTPNTMKPIEGSYLQYNDVMYKMISGILMEVPSSHQIPQSVKNNIGRHTIYDYEAKDLKFKRLK